MLSLLSYSVNIEIRWIRLFIMHNDNDIGLHVHIMTDALICLGKNSVDQIKLIVGCLGAPDNNLLDLCQSPIIRTFLQG